MGNNIPVSDFVILTLGNINQDLGGRMLDVEESKDGGSIVGDGCVFMGGDHFVHASGTWLVRGVPRVVLMMSTIA